MSAHGALRGRPDAELLRLAPGATHQHYKGGLYRLLGPVRDADTGEPLLGQDGLPRVVYQHLYPHEPGLWVRDRTEFFGEVKAEKLEPLGQDIGGSPVPAPGPLKER